MNWAESKTIPSGILALLLSLEPGTAGAGPSGGSQPVGERWRLFSDRVMGGVSNGTLEQDAREGRACLRMQGDVRLDNNGGFVQVASSLTRSEQQAFSNGDGIELEVYGNSESYNVHLRTEDMRRPWQSYRASFVAEPAWRHIRLPFSAFDPYRIDAPLQPGRVQRIGLVAIGREFSADLCIARVAVYQD